MNVASNSWGSPTPANLTALAAVFKNAWAGLHLADGAKEPLQNSTEVGQSGWTSNAMAQVIKQRIAEAFEVSKLLDDFVLPPD